MPAVLVRFERQERYTCMAEGTRPNRALSKATQAGDRCNKIPRTPNLAAVPMRWRVSVEQAGADGIVEVHEVGVGEHPQANGGAPQILDGLVAFYRTGDATARRLGPVCRLTASAPDGLPARPGPRGRPPSARPREASVP